MTAKLSLSNPRQPSLAPVEASALADTGAVFLCIPEHVRFKNRTGCVGALVLGEQVLLGAIPLEDMDLVVNPRDGSVDVNPDSPNMAQGICMRAA